MDQRSARETTFAFSLYADHFQFYLGDSELDGDTSASDFWSDAAFERRLAVGHGILAVETELYGTVPVALEVREGPPLDDPAVWDHVAEAGLDLPSGYLAIDGCLDYMPHDLPRIGYRSPLIEVAPGAYRVRVHYGGLGTQRFGETPFGGQELSDEQYRVVLWPAPYAAPAIVHSTLPPRDCDEDEEDGRSHFAIGA